VVGKPKNRKEGSYALVGHHMIDNIDRVRPHTLYDDNVIVHFDRLENIFDYIFSSLGMGTSTQGVAHPIIITEPVCTPNYVRAHVTNLLFQCYGVPAICYGVDSLFAWHHNASPASSTSTRTLSIETKDSKNTISSNSSNDSNGHGVGPVRDGLVIASGSHATHIYPVLDGRPLFDHARRILVGSHHTRTFLQAVLGLTYPHHRPLFTLERCQDIQHRFTYLCTERQGYVATCQHIIPVDLRRPNCRPTVPVEIVTVQLPFAAADAGTESQEEADAKMERKRENAAVIYALPSTIIIFLVNTHFCLYTFRL
jgi:actin-related protein 5